mgnify:CR=1 FL=1
MLYLRLENIFLIFLGKRCRIKSGMTSVKKGRVGFVGKMDENQSRAEPGMAWWWCSVNKV